MVYEPSGEGMVALCLSTIEANEEELVRKIDGIFGAMFATGQHLEIMFVRNAIETRVAAVCEPFYVRDIPAD